MMLSMRHRWSWSRRKPSDGWPAGKLAGISPIFPGNAYNAEMREGFGIVIFFGIIFIGWLMWSSEDQKKFFLGYIWLAMIVVGTLGTLYEFLKR